MVFLGNGVDSVDNEHTAVQLPQLKQVAASFIPNSFRLSNKSGLTAELIVLLH
jgi:hypothetical protein